MRKEIIEILKEEPDILEADSQSILTAHTVADIANYDKYKSWVSQNKYNRGPRMNNDRFDRA